MTFSRSDWLKHKDNPEFRAALAKGESLDRFETPEPGEAGTWVWSGKTFTAEEHKRNYERIIEHQEREAAARKKPAADGENTVVADVPTASWNGQDLRTPTDPLVEYAKLDQNNPEHIRFAVRSGLYKAAQDAQAKLNLVAAQVRINETVAMREAFRLSEAKRLKDEAAAREREVLETKLQQLGGRR